MSHIFISYKHGDSDTSDFLQSLETRIQSVGISIWQDIKKINAGENWEEIIDSAIDNCFALLLLLTENVASSQYVTYEWTRALTLEKPVIPIRLSKQAIPHPRLEKTQYIDFTENSE